MHNFRSQSYKSPIRPTHTAIIAQESADFRTDSPSVALGVSVHMCEQLSTPIGVCSGTKWVLTFCVLGYKPYKFRDPYSLLICEH